MVEIKKTRTMLGTLVDITPPDTKARRFLRMKGRSGSLTYSDQLEFIVLGEDGQIEDGFRTSELIRAPQTEKGYVTFETKNSCYKFRQI